MAGLHTAPMAAMAGLAGGPSKPPARKRDVFQLLAAYVRLQDLFLCGEGSLVRVRPGEGPSAVCLSAHLLARHEISCQALCSGREHVMGAWL